MSLISEEPIAQPPTLGLCGQAEEPIAQGPSGRCWGPSPEEPIAQAPTKMDSICFNRHAEIKELVTF